MELSRGKLNRFSFLTAFKTGFLIGCQKRKASYIASSPFYLAPIFRPTARDWLFGTFFFILHKFYAISKCKFAHGKLLVIVRRSLPRQRLSVASLVSARFENASVLAPSPKLRLRSGWHLELLFWQSSQYIAALFARTKRFFYFVFFKTSCIFLTTVL